MVSGYFYCMAKVLLFHRHYGVHSLVKEIEIEGRLCRYARLKRRDEYIVDEERLLSALPDDFMPVSPDNCLLMIGDKRGSTGQIGLKLFKNWAKYFDSYSIEISN